MWIRCTVSGKAETTPDMIVRVGLLMAVASVVSLDWTLFTASFLMVMIGKLTDYRR